jgi:hypothetical protein
MTDRMPDYAQGFKDGFASGLEEGKKLVEEQWRQDKIKELEKSIPKPITRLDDYLFGASETCPKCGMKIDGLTGFVCGSPNCPCFSNVTCGIGAIGSSYDPNTKVMSSKGPYDGPEYENKVWINGEWAHLGN